MLAYAAHPRTSGALGAAIRDRLLPGEELAQGQELRTSNGGRLVLQTDGNFVLYAPNGRAIWATDTSGKPVTRAVMQKDGNLVMRSPLGYGGVPEGRGWWDSGTANRGVTQLLLQTDGNLVWYKGEAAAQNAVSATGTHNWAKSPHWQKDDGNFITNAVNAATSVINTAVDAVSDVAHTVEQVPVIGDAVHIINEVNATPFRFVSSVVSGARLDHAVVGELKNQLKIVKEAAPYAQTVVALVPGVGTGVAAAIGAGAALAEGQSITEAAKSAIRSAVPGGAIGAAAFDVAVKAASGQNITQATLEAARAAIPDPNAKKAFDIGVAVATGEKLQTALANGLASLAPAQMQTLLAAGQKAITATPALASALKSARSSAAAQGVTLAAGLLSQSGMNEKALTAVRDKLSTDVRKGFDDALNSQAKQITWLGNVTRTSTTSAPKILDIPKPASATKAPVIVDIPKKTPAPPKTSAPTIVDITKKTSPATAPVASSKYAPYPRNVSGVGVGLSWSSNAWRWFVVYANGTPIAQRGPIWLSDSAATAEAESFLESTQGYNYIGTVTRWDWDPNAGQWRKARSGGF